MQVIRPSSRTAKLMQKAPGVGSPSQQCSPNWALGPGLEFEHVMLVKIVPGFLTKSPLNYKTCTCFVIYIDTKQ